MTRQTSFDAFAEERKIRDEHPDPWEFDEYGPTMDEPIEWVAPAETEALHESGAELVDEREIPDSGLSLSDITDWPSQNREQDRPERIEQWREEIAKLEDADRLEHEKSRRAVADGGKVVEESEEWGSYEPGDTVRLIEDVAVGLNTAPNIIEGEVSSSGKSVMIPEDADSIHGSRRLDAETIFAGDSEYRDSTGYELYTPGRYRNKQRSNYGPGPQAGANEVSDADNLPEPTHWPEGDELDDAPDECPECGATGPWNDVGRPRCERCGVTVDPGAEDADDETANDTPDKWDLSRLERGDVLILDSYRGEFVVISVNTYATNQTVRSVDAVQREGGEWRTYELEKLDSMKGPRLKIEREGETTPFVNVDDPDHPRDFEVVGSDMDRVRRYIRDSRGR